MTVQNTMADTPMEGDIPLTPKVEADETATDSPTETKDTEDTQSLEGDDEENTQDENEEGGDDDTSEDTEDGEEGDGEDDTKEIPFHEHPRWKQREEEWEKRFNDQETRHQDDMKKLREEFGAKPDKADDLKSEEAPDWFGGTPEQWKSFKEWNNNQMTAAAKLAETKISESKNAEAKAVKEATDFFKSELSAIEADPKLNPSGKSINANELLKTAMENELIDSKGRWNYRAAIKIMNAASPAKTVNKNTDKKKKIASATTSEAKAETSPKSFKTTKDFQTNRPW